MKAIYWKELKSFFSSFTGYAYISFFLLTLGLYFTAINLRGDYSQFGYVLANMNYVLIIAAPILTMRSLAEEKRQKTDQLLLTSPLRYLDIVLGKYLALLTVFSLPLLAAAACPLLLLHYGAEDLATAYSSLFGFFLLGGACVAIGLYFSSLTENQIIAAAATFFILLMGYLARDTIRLFANAGPLNKLLSWFNLFKPFYRFISGVFDLAGVIYYCSVSALFLYLTGQVLEKKSWN